jgi:hypothetical protein
MIAWLITGLLTGTISRAALAAWRRRQRRAWRLDADFRTGEQDVIPLHDLVDHTHGDECVCGPEVLAEKCDDGCVHWIYQHHSLDGREMGERRGSVA